MSQGQADDLMVSLRAVNRARSILDLARSGRSWRGGVTLEQWRLMVALESYAAALASQGLPMPYRQRNELAMYRIMFSARRR